VKFGFRGFSELRVLSEIRTELWQMALCSKLPTGFTSEEGESVCPATSKTKQGSLRLRL
jgi:hypothetical protein